MQAFIPTFCTLLLLTLSWSLVPPELSIYHHTLVLFRLLGVGEPGFVAQATIPNPRLDQAENNCAYNGIYLIPEALAAQPTSGAIPNAKGEPERTPCNIPLPPLPGEEAHTTTCLMKIGKPPIRNKPLKVDYSRKPGARSVTAEDQVADKKSALIVTSCLDAYAANFSAETPPPPPQCLPSPYHLLPEEELFKVVEEMPRFPGCEELPTAQEKRQCADKKLLEFIFQNLRYPAAACENRVEGTVVIQFVIEKDGSVTNARAVRDIGARCGEEALRVVNLMNEQGLKWIPAKQRGHTVRVQFNLPVKFRIDCPEMQPTAAFQEPAPGPDAREEIPEQANEALPPTEATPSGTPLTFGPEGFRLFPNPATDRLNLCLQPGPGPVALSIVNTSGQLLWKQEYREHGGILEEQVSLAQWPSGTYLLSIEQAGTRQSHLFIKHP